MKTIIWHIKFFFETFNVSFHLEGINLTELWREMNPYALAHEDIKKTWFVDKCVNNIHIHVKYHSKI